MHEAGAAPVSGRPSAISEPPWGWGLGSGLPKQRKRAAKSRNALVLSHRRVTRPPVSVAAPRNATPPGVSIHNCLL